MLMRSRSWVGVIISTIPIGVANYAIYYATIDYMVASYGEYSASATGGNGFARDFLAGMCALYTKPMFQRLGIQNTYFLLFGLAVCVCIPVYIFYYKGPAIRSKSRFAVELEKQRKSTENTQAELAQRRKRSGSGPERAEKLV